MHRCKDRAYFVHVTLVIAKYIVQDVHKNAKKTPSPIEQKQVSWKADIIPFDYRRDHYARRESNPEPQLTSQYTHMLLLACTPQHTKTTLTPCLRTPLYTTSYLPLTTHLHLT